LRAHRTGNCRHDGSHYQEMGFRAKPDIAKHETQWAAGIAAKIVHSSSISSVNGSAVGPPALNSKDLEPLGLEISLEPRWFSGGRILAVTVGARSRNRALASTLERPKSSCAREKNLDCQH
jgi:hypothetical protein